MEMLGVAPKLDPCHGPVILLDHIPELDPWGIEPLSRRARATRAHVHADPVMPIFMHPAGLEPATVS